MIGSSTKGVLHAAHLASWALLISLVPNAACSNDGSTGGAVDMQSSDDMPSSHVTLLANNTTVSCTETHAGSGGNLQFPGGNALACVSGITFADPLHERRVRGSVGSPWPPSAARWDGVAINRQVWRPTLLDSFVAPDGVFSP